MIRRSFFSIFALFVFAGFRIDVISKWLARKDFDRAVRQANALQHELPRALARIAIARAAFES